MIQAVIFDMFETLVTHYESPMYMGRQMTEDIGIEESAFRKIWDATDSDRTLGRRTLEDVIEEILRVNDRYSRALFEKIITKRKQAKEECLSHLHPEILPLLDALKSENIRIGLITNCFLEERDIIKNSALYAYFDAPCMSCELGMKKPDPAIFQKCLSDLRLPADACMYVGDGGSFELETARRLGMHPLQAAWYFKDGVKQPSVRNDDFLQAESPMAVLTELHRYNARRL